MHIYTYIRTYIHTKSKRTAAKSQHLAVTYRWGHVTCTHTFTRTHTPNPNAKSEHLGVAYVRVTSEWVTYEWVMSECVTYEWVTYEWVAYIYRFMSHTFERHMWKSHMNGTRHHTATQCTTHWHTATYCNILQHTSHTSEGYIWKSHMNETRHLWKSHTWLIHTWRVSFICDFHIHPSNACDLCYSMLQCFSFGEESHVTHSYVPPICNTPTWRDSFICTVVTHDTGWQRPTGCLKSQVIFRKWATNYRDLLRKITYQDKAPYDSMPPCIRVT